MLTLFVKRLILSILKTRLARDKFCTRFCTSRCEKSEICWICEIAGQRVFKNLRLINYLQNVSSVRILTEEPFFFYASNPGDFHFQRDHLRGAESSRFHLTTFVSA